MNAKGPPVDLGETLRRRRRLARMKALATGLLIAMALVLVALRLLGARGEIAAAVAAFAEAALIGGLADWFAVHALFRRPFGLPIPHTAILPRNKDRIGRALGRFIVDNFLSPEIVESRLAALDLGSFVGRWLQKGANARLAAETLLAGVAEIATAAPGRGLADLATAAARAAAAGAPAAPTAGALLRLAWREGRADAVASGLARVVQTFLRTHEEAVLEIVEAQSWAIIPSFVDRAIARRITEGLIQLLGDLEAETHPWRLAMGAAVERLADRLSTDPELAAAGEEIKARVLSDPALSAELDHLVTAALARLDGGDGALQHRLETVLAAAGRVLATDPSARRSLNAAAEGLIRRLLLPRRRRIGRFVAEVVEAWNAEDLTDRLELLVGPDLQFIRVNGAVVGGLAGLFLHLIGRVAG